MCASTTTSSTSTRPDSTLSELPAPTGLDAIFRPRSVAVIGASRRPGSIGGAIFRNLLAHGFEGPVFPVNRSARVVQSVLAYPTVSDIPGGVDLAVIAVPSRQVLAAVEECGQKGVRGVIIITAGFKETGPEGAQLERAVRDAARRHQMRLVGPNCLGVLNTEQGVHLDATFAPAWPPAGPVAFSSHSWHPSPSCSPRWPTICSRRSSLVARAIGSRSSSCPQSKWFRGCRAGRGRSSRHNRPAACP